MVIQELALGGGMFFASDSTVARNSASTCNDPCAPSEDYSIVVGNDSKDIANTSDPFSKGERPGREPNALVQHTQHTCESSDAKLAMIQLV
jgi:hypothetical protein